VHLHTLVSDVRLDVNDAHQTQSEDRDFSQISDYKFEIGLSLFYYSVVRQPERLQDDVSWLCGY
jgi:hypothetical protein